MKEFFDKAKIFVKHNWKGAVTFIALVVAVVVFIALGELYQYLALNVWAS